MSPFNTHIVVSQQDALDLVKNVLASCTEYSIIGQDLNGNIVLWNEGARRMYGYEKEEIVALNASVL